MPTNKYFACPFCNERFTREDMVTHIDKKHDGELPEGFTPLRATFHVVNRKDLKYRRPCRICRKPTEWDENKGRYNFLCSNPNCKKLWVQNMKETMGDKYGAFRPTETAEGLEKMLANRKISGTYKFSTGGEVPYTGSYEKKALEFMDLVLGVKMEDLEVPGPAIKYPYKGKDHIYIPDIYYRPYNLIIEIKDGGSNPNTHPGFAEVRAKKIAKEKHVINNTKYNYIRLTDNNFGQLLAVFADLKMHLVNDDRNKVSHINESVDATLREHMGVASCAPIVGFTPGDAVILTKPMNRVFAVTDSPYFEKVVTINQKGLLGFEDKDKYGDNYKMYVKKDCMPNIEKALKDYIGKELSESAFYELVFGHPQYSSDQILFEDMICLTDIQDNIAQDLMETTLELIGFNEKMEEFKAGHFDEYRSTFFSENDIKYNYDAFVRGASDILFITGVSNKGKTEDAESISNQYGADVIHLDDVQKHYLYSDKKLRQKHILIYKYFCDSEEGVAEREKKKKDPEVNLYETIPHFLQFFLANRDPHKRYIVEGPQLMDLLAADRIKFDILEKYSIIFKDSNMLQTKSQVDDIQNKNKLFELLGDYVDFMKDKVSKASYDKLPKNLKKKVDNDRPLDDIVKDALGETASFRYPSLYFVSEHDAEELGDKLTPRIPDNYLTKNGYEDNKTPRVCFSNSINGCLIGLSQNLKGKHFYVYTPTKEYKFYSPTTKEVPDARITGEKWITSEVDITCIGEIEVTEVIDSPLPYTYGDNKKAELYAWDWKWIDKYSSINEAAMSTPVVSDPYFIKSDDGVDNACVDIQGYDHPCRGRSSMLILKFEDGEWKVFLSKDKEKGHEYHAPGGGWNKGEDPKDAAIREAKEEVYINVKDVKFEGYLLEYHEEVQDWVKEHVSDPKKWWYGYYSEIYVGMYDSKFTGKVDDRDKDQMANSGKWYSFKEIKEDLAPREYREAIENYIMSSVNEACKDLATATNNDRSNKAVKHARDAMKRWEEDHGFDSKEDWSLNESTIFNQKDLYYNKDKFDSGEINLCFIVGNSGGGKSTMARGMDAEMYELDDVVWNKEKFTMDNFKKYGDLIYSFFNGPGKKYYYTKQDIDEGLIKPVGDAYEELLINDFVRYAISYAKAHKNKKFVLEGVWIVDFVNPELIKDYAVYIKGTSLLVSRWRAAKRDSQDAPEGKRFESRMKNLFNKNLWKQNNEFDKDLQKFRSYFESRMRGNNMLESTYIESTDCTYNLNLLDPNSDNNMLWVSGLTGAGKSSLSRDLHERYNMGYVCLDDVSRWYSTNPTISRKAYNNLKEYCPEAILFEETHPMTNYDLGLPISKTNRVQTDFCNWFIENYNANGRLYVLEGDILTNNYPVDWFSERPTIIKQNTYQEICNRRGRRPYKNLQGVTEDHLQSAVQSNLNNPKLYKLYEYYIDFCNDLQSIIEDKQTFYCLEDDTQDLTSDLLPVIEVTEEDLKKNMELSPVFVVLSFNGSIVGKVIKGYGKDLGWEYSHSSISLLPSLGTLYSFNITTTTDEEGKKHKYNGLAIEHFRDFRDNPKCKIKVIAILVDTETKAKIRKAIQYYIDNIDKTKYATKSLGKALFGKGANVQNYGNMTLFCSQFVDAVLKQADIDIGGRGSSINTHPSELGQFKDKNNYFTVYEGKASGYNEDIITQKINYMKQTMDHKDLNAITDRTNIVHVDNTKVENRAKQFVNRKIEKVKANRKNKKPEPLDGPLTAT